MPAAAATLNPYAAFLSGREPLTILDTTAGRLQFLTQTIGDDKIATPPVAGKWSARDILCHLADCEMVFAFRLRQTLSEEHHLIQPFNQDSWAASYEKFSAPEALATFTAARRWNLLLIEAALPSQGAKLVTHPERGTMSFATIVETMAGHDLNHLAQLEQIAAAGSH